MNTTNKHQASHTVDSSASRNTTVNGASVKYANVLKNLFQRYSKAIASVDTEEMNDCCVWLERNFNRFDREDPEINGLMLQIQDIHWTAMRLVRQKMNEIESEMNSARSTQQRDAAYSVTQVSTNHSN